VSRRLPTVHAITNDAILALADFEERALAIAAAGSVALHIRSATHPAGRLAATARALVREGATVFVNDRADLVAHAGAAGLHLPERGLPTAAARRLVGAGVSIGRSTHDANACRDALRAGADYAFLGPIWETPSHPGVAGLGLDGLATACPGPVIAIGGVTPSRAPACRRAGAAGIAAIRALWLADDPGSAASALLLSFGSDAA
jgi:thiamine-phosphate pyrophosphorylase